MDESGRSILTNIHNGGVEENEDESQPELIIVPLGFSISLTVRQRGKAIYSVFFLGGSSSVLVVLATILMSG